MLCADNCKFACDWPDCRKSFLHAENLTSHRRQHTEPKPFRCDQCPLAYWQKSSLRSHRLKVHSPGTTARHNVDKSAQLLASASSAGQLVDGIIKSVTASMQAANSSALMSSIDVDDGNVRQSPLATESAHTVGPPSHDLEHQAMAGQHLPTEQDQQEAGSRLTQQSTHEVLENTGDDVTAGVMGDLSEHSDTGKPQEPLKTAKLSEPLNVYEFCEDETVDICLPKPARGSTVAPRTTIELPQTTIELNNHSEDDDDHDLMVFDDDLSPTIDRLAGTVITYSRKKKQAVETENPAAKFSKPLSPDVKTATKKSVRRRSASVAGLRQKRTSGMVAVEADCEEPVKRKVRRKRSVDTGDVDSDGLTRNQLSKSSNLTRQSSTSRSTKRSKKNKNAVDSSVQDDDDRSKKSSADDDVASLNSSSAAAADSKKRTQRSGTLTKLDSPKTSPACANTVKLSVREVDDSTEQLDVIRDMASADATGNQARTRKSRDRRRRTTRRTSRKDVKNEDKVEGVDVFATPHQSLLENPVDSQPNAASNSSEVEVDTAASSLHECGADTEPSDAGPAAECLSENTEILSLNDNADDECTRRSSPASYKSEEHNPHVLLPAHQDDDDSKGSYTWRLLITYRLCF